MIARYEHLVGFPSVFRSLTGLTRAEFDAWLPELLTAFAAAAAARPPRADRQRAPGAGHPVALEPRDQLLLTLVWLRQYLIHELLGFLFGVSDSTAGRIIARCLPLLEAAGRASLRLPSPDGKKHRDFADLVADLPEIFVVIDSFEQKIQRPRPRTAADPYYSGKKKTHTIKSQLAVNGQTGEICDVAESVEGPTAAITLLEESGLLDRLPPEVGAEGDLAYVGIGKLRPGGPTATPRKKPRGQERPPADVAYNRAFANRRIIVEHTIGRARRYQAITALDREHRANHTARVRAISGLVNHQLRSRYHSLAA